MDEAGRAYAEGLQRCLAGLEDPRVVPRCAHRLFDIVATTLLAVMCGAEDWPDIASLLRPVRSNRRPQ